MKKYRKYIVIACIVVLIGFVYSFLLNRYKNNVNAVINDVVSGHTDYYNDEFIKEIEDYQSNGSSINLFYVYQKSKFLNSALNSGTCYKTNNITPSIYIYTYDNSGLFLEKQTGYVDCQIVYIDKDCNPIFDYESKIKVRGNSTSVLDKKPYTIKFSEKRDLIDAGEAKKWNLLADAYDPTLMRNNTFLSLAEKLELDYTPEHEYVEIYVDQQYLGCYLLTETVETGKNRVNIDIEDKDFFIEFESYRVEEDVFYFTSKHGIRFALKEPEEPTDEQLKYYQNTIDELDKVLFGNNYEELCKYFDVDSFAKLYLINEFAKTRDFVNSSVNFYYKDGKMYAGPVWDFDLSAGNSDAFKGSKYWDYLDGEEVSYLSYYCRKLNPIFKQLFTFKEFNELYLSYFDKYKEDLNSIYKEGGLIDSTIEIYGSIFKRNYSKLEDGGAGWDVSLLQDTLQTIPFKTYEENVDYLKEFLSNRYNWLINNQ